MRHKRVQRTVYVGPGRAKVLGPCGLVVLPLVACCAALWAGLSVVLSRTTGTRPHGT